ncbi:hypothetical protein N7466_007473 [Penicillium verhagenii]|uniref:uncharacterized protein n=1 Tax=Penicillium verhagenii TaxID=1562060 RepID=UPI002544DC76|nr:uncharacterized protein N7466_007473 [Penicillium verhagenii]KAJ5928517.1 hypothetical protein N7466_007473 [Penicillium verhagenii]
MASTEEPTSVPSDVEVEVAVDANVEVAPPATPVDSTVLSGGEEASDFSPEASKENIPVSPAKTSAGTPAKRPVASTTAAKRPTSASTTSKIGATPTSRTSTSSALNKPPTRPTTTTTTATRKPLGASTTSSHRSRASVSSSADEKPRSIASSGDERRSILGSSKRTSMAATPSTRAPLKSTSTIDRRSSVAGPALDRKPAAPSTATSRTPASTSRPVGKLTSSTTPSARPTSSTSATRPTTTRPTTATSATTRTAAPSTRDPTRRMSTISSTTSRSVGDSEKLQALQAKLTESEETATNLRAELESVNEKLSQLSLVEEATKDSGATESLQAEHSAELAKLASAHANELESLQIRLVEAETQRKELEGKSRDELEAAKQSAIAQGDDQSAAALDELKEIHQAQLEILQKELAGYRDSATALGEQVEALKKDLEEQKAQLTEDKALALNNLLRELEGRDQVLDTLKVELSKLGAAKDEEIKAEKDAAEKATLALREQLASLEAKIAESESTTQHDSEEILNSITEKDQEITDLKQSLAKVQSDLQEAQKASADALSTKVKELEAAHEAAIIKVTVEHDQILSSLSASHAEELTVAKAATESTGTEHAQQLQELTDALESARTAAQGENENAISDLKAAHQLELNSLMPKLEESEKALSESRQALEGHAAARESAIQEVEALRQKVGALEPQVSSGAGKINALQQEVQSKQTEAEELYRSLKNLEGESKSRDVEKENKLKGLQDKAAEATRLLEEHTAKSASVSEQHARDIEALRAEHAAELALVTKEASGSHADALSELQQKHDELLAKNRELESTHETHASQVESFEAELKSIQDRHAGDLATHTKTHEAETAELQKQIQESQIKADAELKALQTSATANGDSHQKEIAELQKDFEKTRAQLQAEIEAAKNSKASDADAEHGRAIEELLTVQESKLANLREELEASHEARLGDLQRIHEVALAKANEQISKANEAAQDTSIVDGLMATVTELEQKLAASEKTHVTFQESAVTTSQEIQEKHAAEVAKILAQHSELAAKHDVALSQIGELQKSLVTSSGKASELESIMKQLSQSQEDVTALRAKHTAVSEELEESRAFGNAMEELVTAGERKMNDQIDKNMTLLNKLGDLDSSISAGRRRVRELEANLASLRAGQLLGAERDRSSSSGLESSQWATADDSSEQDEYGGAATTEGENLGSSIEGTMASIHEQLKHIRSANDEWYEDHRKLIGELSQLSRRATPNPPSQTSTPSPEVAVTAPESVSSRVSSAR